MPPRISILPNQTGIHVEDTTMYPIGISHSPKNNPPTPQACLINWINSCTWTNLLFTSVPVALAISMIAPIAMALIMMATAFIIPKAPTAQAAHGLMPLNNR